MNLKREETHKEVLLPHEGVTARIIFTDKWKSPGQKVRRVWRLKPAIRFESGKCNRIVGLHSRLEYAHAMNLEKETDVSDYREYPFRIEYTGADGINKSITPNFVVYRRNGSKTVEEVINIKNLRSPIFVQLLAIEKATLSKFGYQFKIITEENLMPLRPTRRFSYPKTMIF